MSRINAKHGEAFSPIFAKSRAGSKKTTRASRAEGLALIASLAGAGAAHAELLKFETRADGANEAVSAIVKIDGISYDIAGTLSKPAKPQGGAKAILIEAQSGDDLKALALQRGLAALTLDLAKLPDKAKEPALRDLVTHIRGALKMKRVLGSAQGKDADAMAGAAFDGLLLHDASRFPAPPTRVIETWGADAYWRAVPRAAPVGAEPATKRSFYLAGTAAAVSPDNCAAPVNTRAIAPAMRALLVALDDWTAKGLVPPPSRAPTAAELAKAGDLKWPKVAGFPAPPDRLNVDKAIDSKNGERALSEKRDSTSSQRAPEAARDVPRIDADGNELSGLRLPDHALPIATFTGFNARKEKEKEKEKDKVAPDCVAGAAIPFAPDKAAREKSADPRPSLNERYGSRAYFVATMRIVANKLVKERLLLPEDADAYVAAAKSAPF
ncbi:alpha/beta hydrolase domain-containing protein [Methylocystis sp. 9N]|uniref:Alpha/beta hydrolase domain-containing protein n=1 Tax=Methylocystis borbori TaxID=3118750 RepID=A0ABU7XHV5_9HYPH